MKLKQLSTEFEYFTPKWQIFGLIQFQIIAYIFIEYMNYHCAKFYTNISTNMDNTNIFPFLAIFSSPEPKAQVSYCHSAPSVVRPSVVRP